MINKNKNFDFSKLYLNNFELNDFNENPHSFTIVSVSPQAESNIEDLTIYAIDFKETIKTSKGRVEAMQVLNELKKGEIIHNNKSALVGFEFTISYNQEVDSREGFNFHIISTQNFLQKKLSKGFEVQEAFNTKNIFRFILDLLKYASTSSNGLFSIKIPLRDWLEHLYTQSRGYIWGDNEEREFNKYFDNFVYEAPYENNEEEL